MREDSNLRYDDLKALAPPVAPFICLTISKTNILN